MVTHVEISKHVASQQAFNKFCLHRLSCRQLVTISKYQTCYKVCKLRGEEKIIGGRGGGENNWGGRRK